MPAAISNHQVRPIPKFPGWPLKKFSRSSSSLHPLHSISWTIALSESLEACYWQGQQGEITKSQKPTCQPIWETKQHQAPPCLLCIAIFRATNPSESLDASCFPGQMEACNHQGSWASSLPATLEACPIQDKPVAWSHQEQACCHQGKPALPQSQRPADIGTKNSTCSPRCLFP